jgi:hypothetical protein
MTHPFAKFVSSGLLHPAEVERAYFQAEKEFDFDALEQAALAHEAAIYKRIALSIAPLIASRAYDVAILAQAQHANMIHGRINALSGDDVYEFVRNEIAAALARARHGGGR